MEGGPLPLTLETVPTTPQKLRSLIRQGEWRGTTAGLAPNHVQANLVVLPRAQAFDFLLFCQRNPRPCPLLEVLEPGVAEPSIAPGADIRTDIPRYRIYRDGVLDREAEEITDVWQDDLVTFLLGCSFTFESALMAAGIRLRHVDEGSNVSMYVTNIATVRAGMFSGPLVVSMRPIPRGKVVTVEVVRRLAQRARETLFDLGYNNIVVEDASENLGCPERGPYDAIVVSAAAPSLPQTLMSQLAVGGRMVLPVGDRDQQELVCALRTGEGISLRMLGPCRFVPLIGHEAFPSTA